MVRYEWQQRRVGKMTDDVHYVCLDLINTVSWRTRERPHERLTSYAGLVAWSQEAGVVTEQQAQRLLEGAIGRPADAAMVLEQALALREALYRIFSAVAGGGAPELNDVVTLNGSLAETMARLQLAWTAGEFAWSWTAGDGDALETMLWPVARSAAELLTSDELNRVGVCAGEGCGWLFFDVSKNRSRRWCAMDDCGNRAKARRYYWRGRSQNQKAEE
jgi:predicted RNA-binding Zn ribbon-like protein